MIFSDKSSVIHKAFVLIKEKGYQVISQSDLLQAFKTGHTSIKKPVLLTFDDGYEDNYTALFPLLQKYHVHALIFLITQKIGTAGYLTWPQIKQMQASGLVDFGSHTCSHRRLRSLPDEQIAQEILQSKQVLEQGLSSPVFSFCYPFGAGGFDKRVRPAVVKAGYLFDFSTKKGINPWPWKGTKTILRAFPRGGETLFDYHLQLTRGRSKL